MIVYFLRMRICEFSRARGPGSARDGTGRVRRVCLRRVRCTWPARGPLPHRPGSAGSFPVPHEMKSRHIRIPARSYSRYYSVLSVNSPVPNIENI